MSDSEAVPPSVESDDVAIVLAAIDTSALTSLVVETATRVTRRNWTRAQLHLVHVFRSSPFDRPAAAGLRSEDLMAEAQSHLDFHVRMARRQGSPSVTGHLAVGDPVDEIVRQARSLSADVLLVGIHDTGLFGIYAEQRSQPLAGGRLAPRHVQPELLADQQRARQILGALDVAREPEGAFGQAREQHHATPGSSTTKVSLLPPPCEELTTSEPLRSATRVRPPRVT